MLLYLSLVPLVYYLLLLILGAIETEINADL